MISSSEIILLMTGCVNPGIMPNTALTDCSKRFQQYVSAIQFYLSYTPYKIVFVENTSTDLSTCFPKSVNNGRCEFITFEGNDFDHELGKGYGEGIILKEAFDKSKFLNRNAYVLKLSGRYIISNIKDFLQRSLKTKKFANNDIICNINPWKRGGRRYACSVIFGADYDFYKSYLLPCLEKIDESKKIWFEHILYDSIRFAIEQDYRLYNFPIPIIKEVESGSSGAVFKHPNKLVYFAYRIKFLCYKLNLIRL